VAARFLKKAGHEPVLFEAGETFGGVWADEPTNDVVYKHLQTNLPTAVMQSPDLDFAPGLPSYITKAQLGGYITAYADAFGVAPMARFGARVTRVLPMGEVGGPASAAAADERWRVEWTSGGAEQAETFDAVVVANGHYEEPYRPSLPGEAEWLRADAARTIVHSRRYDDPAEFRGRSVLVVGGRSSGVDIARALRGEAAWVYVLEKKCEAPITHEGEAVTHVPLGTRLCADGLLRVDESGEAVAGPPVDAVVLATGYCYSFPFLDEQPLGMRFKGLRHVTPLHQHMLHASRPTLGFVGIPLAVPCPVPFFECQAAYMAEHLARPAGRAMTSEPQRTAWLQGQMEAVGFDTGRPQDLHLTGAGGGSPWRYMRELLAAVHADAPPTADGESWLERPTWEARLETVEAVYLDRSARQPQLPWHDDAYRRCEYTVDWTTGSWAVDDSRAKRPTTECEASAA